MRILHSADWHIGELNGPTINGENARLRDTLNCINYLIEYTEREKPDVVLISGDLFDKSKLWADNMLIFILEAESRLRELAKIAPTILMFGTETHDNPKAFESIRSMRIPGLAVVTKPEVGVIETQSGPLQIAGLPGFDKGYFRAKNPGMAPAEENQICSKLLGDMVNGLSAQLDPTILSVLMAHYTVVGCEMDNGQHVFTQNEVVLPKEALEGSGFDLVALGHIHRSQRVEGLSKPVFYSGPINGITFNEEGQDKGFWIHTIDQELPYDNVSSEFIKTPSREFWTENWDDIAVQDFLNGIWPANPAYYRDKIIRIHYSCSDELNKKLNRKSIERALYDVGAFYVAEIKPEKITTELVKQELTETSGPLENLHSWLVSEGFEDAVITDIIELAKPLIAAVSAKMPTGTLDGMFEPRTLTVKNYRSYLEESFNFQDIYFATVNGKNGIGKSAFFMDAISDCLYEEPRTGVTGSWITNGQTEGSIWFEFSMGSSVWRVIRARSIKSSGKIVLALDEYVDNEWVSRSGTTARETQQKIETLLGMDCATFQCTALIMQDAYGKFMEADKESRMSVLGNILGLGVYEQLTDLAKAKITELNRELAVKKSKMDDLDEKLKDKDELDAARQNYEADIKKVAEDIKLHEDELKMAEELVRTLKTKAEKAQEIQSQITVLVQETAAKQNEISEKRQQAERAKKIVENEAVILAKAQEHEQVRDKVTVLEAKKPRLQELETEMDRLVAESQQLDVRRRSFYPQIEDLEKILINRNEIEEAAELYKIELAKLEKMDELSAKATAKNQEILTVEKDTDRILDEIHEKELSLKGIKLQLDELNRKSALLMQSNCIDPNNSKCAFLADAREAKTQIHIVEQQIKDIEQEIAKMQEVRKPYVELAEKLYKEYDVIGYNLVKDVKAHYELKNLVANLRPKAELAGQLESKAELLNNLKNQQMDIEKRNMELRAKLREAHESKMKLNDELSELLILTERLPKLLDWVKAKEELPAARQLISSTDDIIRRIEAEIADKQKRAMELETERVTLEIEANRLFAAEYNVTLYRDNVKEFQDKQNSLHSKLGAINAQLEALAAAEQERQQISTEMSPIAKRLTHYQTLSRAFGTDGIPFSIIRSVVPELSMMANDILGKMTGGQMALEIQTERLQRNKKEVNVIEVLITDWRGTISYGNRSGGQRVKAALANAFALADLKARRAGIQLGMMWVDEPPFLDDEGTEAYCDALELLNTRNRAMKVIAISHDQSMKARFPQQIEVVDMGELGSKVRIG